MLGEVLAEAGLEAGYEVSWLPSYGPEMRSGTSNCHVRLASRPIDSPLVSRPNVLLAMNEPSLRKFLGLGGARRIGPVQRRQPLRGIARARCARTVHSVHPRRRRDGRPRIANIVMLGALLEITGTLPQDSIDAALHRLVKSTRWYELDERALERGCNLYRDSLAAI